jgi:acyl carrier protein
MARGMCMRNDVVKTQQLEIDLLDLVAKEAMVDRDTLTPGAMLDELSIASADFVMILMAIEEKYGIYISVDNEMADLKSVQDLLDLASTKITEEEA